jgi:hypothetical protein
MNSLLAWKNLSCRRKRWILWITAGVLLRLVFIVFSRHGDDDTAVYLELGHNLFHRGIYGLTGENGIAPSLFRLPGYPLFLATMELLFARIWPNAWMNTVFAVQAAADLAGGVLLAAFARRHLSSRTAEAVLALAMLCPFTASYVGIAMTECLSIFAVSLGLYAAGRALGTAQAGRRDGWALVGAGCAAALAMLLRADGALLFAALAGGLFWYTARSGAAAHGWRRGLRSGLASATLFSVVALASLAPWTIRNWMVFRVFQPLAPRYANDPGESTIPGYQRWTKSWLVEFVSSFDVYWKVGAEPIDIGLLPSRAFDSAEQYRETQKLLQDYNAGCYPPSEAGCPFTPEIDARFDALARERIDNHPLRYYVGLPLARVADMWLRPRTEYMGDAAPLRWWEWREDPGGSLFAFSYGLLNAALLALAVVGFVRRRVPFAAMLGAYLVLRCLLLANMQNAEPRYTLEGFPIVLIAAALAIAGRPKAESEQSN